MVSVYFILLQMINLKIFQIGAFFILASDWFQNGFKLAKNSDRDFRFQIASDCFQIPFRLVWKNCKTSYFVFTFQIALDWTEPQQRRMALPPPYLPRNRRSCNGPTYNDGWRLRLPNWRDRWMMRSRRTKSPRGK